MNSSNRVSVIVSFNIEDTTVVVYGTRHAAEKVICSESSRCALGNTQTDLWARF